MKLLHKSSTDWLLLRSPPADAAHNMAVDAALLEAAPSLSKPLLRFYSWTLRAASFGYFQKIADVERATLLRPLVRRPTGGGIVPHDADWTYSAIFPPNAAWYELKAIQSYRRIHEWLRDAFHKIGITTEIAPTARKAEAGQCFAGHEQFDLIWHGKKIAGAAQRRTRSGLLIQGSVQPPPVKVSRADWESAMLRAAEETQQAVWHELVLDTALARRITELAASIYSQESYNRRR